MWEASTPAPAAIILVHAWSCGGVLSLAREVCSFHILLDTEHTSTLPSKGHSPGKEAR